MNIFNVLIFRFFAGAAILLYSSGPQEVVIASGIKVVLMIYELQAGFSTCPPTLCPMAFQRVGTFVTRYFRVLNSEQIH
jgi:hypothetical protein